MSPTHVLVSDDANERAAYASAFDGAVDLYCFDSNVEVYERLITAQAPIDMLVVSPKQSSVFNLDPARLVDRIGRPPLASSQFTANMQVIVIGTELPMSERVHSVPTLEAAIRMVKFGEVEATPEPMPAYEAPATPAPVPAGPSMLADSVISSIWDNADQAAAAAPVAPAQPMQAAPVAPAAELAAQPQVAANVPRTRPGAHPMDAEIRPAAAATPELFVQSVVPTDGDSDAKVAGGGAQAPVADVIEPAMLPHEAQQSVIQAATVSNDPAPITNAPDPLLGWSGSVQRQLTNDPHMLVSTPAEAQAMPAPAAMQAQHVPMQQHEIPQQMPMQQVPVQTVDPQTMAAPVMHDPNAPMPVDQHAPVTMAEISDSVAAVWDGNHAQAQPQPQSQPQPGAAGNGQFDAPDQIINRAADDGGGVQFG